MHDQGRVDLVGDNPGQLGKAHGNVGRRVRQAHLKRQAAIASLRKGASMSQGRGSRDCAPFALDGFKQQTKLGFVCCVSTSTKRNRRALPWVCFLRERVVVDPDLNLAQGCRVQ